MGIGCMPTVGGPWNRGLALVGGTYGHMVLVVQRGLGVVSQR